MFKKMLAAGLSIATVLSLTAMVASADSYDDFRTPSEGMEVKIDSKAGIAKSGNVVGTFKIYSAANSSSSTNTLFVVPRYTLGYGWYDDATIPLVKGSKLDETSTRRFNSDATWYLQLNPKGTGSSGCKGIGYIRNK